MKRSKCEFVKDLHLLTHSFNTHFLSTYYVARYKEVNKTELRFNGRSRHFIRQSLEMPTKVRVVKVVVFPVVVHGCENWTIKKAEC